MSTKEEILSKYRKNIQKKYDMPDLCAGSRQFPVQLCFATFG